MKTLIKSPCGGDTATGAFLSVETFEKRPLLANPPPVTGQVGVRLKFQSSKYVIYSCG